MNYKDYEYPGKKFRTCHRDDMYHVIKDNDPTDLFSSIIDMFQIAFAIGFHLGKREPVGGSNAINHTNISAMKISHQDLIILLMLDRHPEIADAQTLWNMVEEYAEYGIGVLFESLRRSDWVLDVGDVFTEV